VWEELQSWKNLFYDTDNKVSANVDDAVYFV